MASEQLTNLVGGAYILIGVVGFLCNTATVLMIATNRVYRLSAYTIMANIALADAIMMLVAGVVCGSLIVWTPMQRPPLNMKVDTAFGMSILMGSTSSGASTPTVPNVQPLQSLERHQLLATESDLEVGLYGLEKSSTFSYPEDYMHTGALVLAISLLEIAAWTAGVVSYAFLGFNRCIAIRFYGTKAKSLNRVSVALFASLVTWAIATITACVGSIPDPLMGIRKDMWTISFLRITGARPATFITIASLFNLVSVTAQWLCSAVVLIKIREVREKINKNKLNVNSANRFRKQARLTFQFFYPSILCTISSVVYFAKPFMIGSLAEWQFVLLHAVWLCNHMCNPFIYAYFNERMRLSYRNFLTCAPLRYIIRKKRKQHGFVGRHRRNVSMRSFGAGARTNRMSTRSLKTTRDGNFVRNSLQMQSRDFEQLCEFMMRVNPLYDSSEGWQESSDDEEQQSAAEACPICTDNNRNQEPSHLVQEPHSIVLDLGRQTVEHWARFAKKASI